MTIIATDGKVMAGDTRITADKMLLLSDAFPKVHRLKDGRVFGCSGSVVSMENARLWLEAGAPGGDDRPQLDKDTFEGLILDADGVLQWFDDSCVMVPMEPPYAIGSGADVAFAFLRSGYSPEQAVAAAIKSVVTCGGTVIKHKPTRKRF